MVKIEEVNWLGARTIRYELWVRTLESSSLFHKGEVFRVAVIVEKGTDYRGPITERGYILVPKDKNYYPYVWDAERFEILQGTPYELAYLTAVGGY